MPGVALATSSAEDPVARGRLPAEPLSPLALLVPIFGASGAMALVDQVCFAKYLSYVLGSTAHAVSAVLGAFMTGLALGALAGGKWSAHSRRFFSAYGAAELAVAVSVAMTPWGFAALEPLYVSLARAVPDSLWISSILRWLVAFGLVVIPTTAMGATLPLLSQAVRASEAQPDRSLGALYAANTLGGAIGALGCAYALLPWLGLSATLYWSAAASGFIGVAALIIDRLPVPAKRARASGGAGERSPRASEGRDVSETQDPAAPQREWIWLAVLAIASGALVFGAEVVFTHLLALIIGNSAYAFGLILAVFLCCLFFGASQSNRAQRRLGESALVLGLLAAAAMLALTLPLWDKLPLLFDGAGRFLPSFAAREALRAAVAFAILVVPTTSMGLTFPLLLQRVAVVAELGRVVGRLTALNTVGAVAGSLFAGYALLPVLGSRGSLMAIAGAYFALGVGTRVVASRGRALRFDRAAIGLGALTAAALAFGPPWDLTRLTAGTNVYFESPEPPDRLVMLREDVQGGVTTVTSTNGILTLYTNGKFQGNTGWEMQAQRMFAHYPSLFVDSFDRALVIGLGTGTTLGTLGAYPWRRIDVVEISEAIVEATSHFAEANRNVLEDPRVHLHIGDGRNHLMVDPERYDLISMELSSIWFAGASSLYSSEYYALVSEHLRPHGVFQQWVQLHHIERRTFAAILNTLRKHFYEVVLFYGGGQGVLVASNHRLVASRTRLERLASTVASFVPRGRTLIEFVDDVLVLDGGLDEFIEFAATEAGEPVDALISTDDNLYLEYATPRGNVLPWSTRDALVRELLRFRDDSRVQSLVGP